MLPSCPPEQYFQFQEGPLISEGSQCGYPFIFMPVRNSRGLITKEESVNIMIMVRLDPRIGFIEKSMQILNYDWTDDTRSNDG
jgi:hypothetical protein